jgi:transposase
MNKRYLVTLSDAERESLDHMVHKGKADARVRCRAQILLKADEPVGWTDERIAEAFGVSTRTVERVRQHFVEQGLETTLRPPRSPRPPRKVDGVVEAHLVALTCSQPPAGRSRWTLRLLAQKMVELGHVESLSHEGVRATLKKMC